MNYKVIDRETYYRKGVFRHFSDNGITYIGIEQFLLEEEILK